MSGIELRNLRKEFGDLVAVDDVSVSVRDGELLCLLGPSGCGKSTTMRMIGGLETPTDGEVHIGDREVTDLPAYRRNTSMVFQSWALFPYKSVRENVAFGLKMQGVDADERAARADEMLERVEMAGYGDHAPMDLSGGQKQRVALARSLVVDPDVLLLDEPLSNLDKRLREQMEIELKQIHEEFEKTFVHVTHDQDEAFTLADRIGIMNAGRLVQVGEPSEVYERPKNEFVEEFLGDTNLVSGTVVRTDGERATADLGFGTPVDLPVGGDLSEGASVTVSLRPEVLTLQRRDGADGVETDGTRSESPAPARPDGTGAGVTGTVDSVLYRGSQVRYSVTAGETSIFVERSVTDHGDVATGDDVAVTWATEDLLAFRPGGERLGETT